MELSETPCNEQFCVYVSCKRQSASHITRTVYVSLVCNRFVNLPISIMLSCVHLKSVCCQFQLILILLYNFDIWKKGMKYLLIFIYILYTSFHNRTISFTIHHWPNNKIPSRCYVYAEGYQRCMIKHVSNFCINSFVTYNHRSLNVLI